MIKPTGGWGLPLLLLLIVACTSGEIGANVGPDPSSLAELSGLGGASYEPLDSLEAAARSDVAVEVEIIDIKRTHLNTVDREFPSAEQLEKLGADDLTALTDVEAKVRRLLSSGGKELSFDEGSLITITVGGGLYDTVLNSKQAEAMGVTESVNDSLGPTESQPGSPDDEGQGDAIQFSWGSTPGINFTEGDVLAVFLVEFEILGYGTDNIVILGPIHPMGVLIEDNGGWKVHGSEDYVELDALLQTLGSSIP